MDFGGKVQDPFTTPVVSNWKKSPSVDRRNLLSRWEYQPSILHVK